MADDGLIAAYLRELRFSVASLADADDIVAESEDHLAEAVERLCALGRPRAEAEAEAVARFGSAALISKVCVAESRRGAAVPTRRTRQAGLAALLAPLLLIVGQWGNVTIDRGAGHGVAVILLSAALPAFLFGLWGLRTRHGGLGRFGMVALVLAVASPVLSLVAAWAAIFALGGLLCVAATAFAVLMLRASVLPVAPLVVFAAGPIGGLALACAAGIVTASGGDAGDLPSALIALPVCVTAVGFGWLGWHLWREQAVDRQSSDRTSFAAV